MDASDPVVATGKAINILDSQQCRKAGTASGSGLSLEYALLDLNQ
jgi:hypothetical protein